MKNGIQPTNREVLVSERDFIVSKTDTKGRIVYANRLFMKISGYREAELLGKQHNLLRHPDMPRGVFHLLWSKIMQGHECFAYIKNLCKNGDHYWVLANVTPDYDPMDQIIGYFSVRRKPSREAVDYFNGLYQQMLSTETRAGPKNAVTASTELLNQAINDQGFENYETFVFGHQT
ncbi:MAG: PAS domain-containing protein [Candidatus Thiodiazotropha lotti]|uniref:Aerotaxis receptor Aer n=1 Tax=Candidatus Thiodiazotropha endoloripes TaxID=1818881 RepID=A0A1E2UN08_9GAMM|nr:PAS domain-containing protein [Candidatus Thiodiazotropha endoloripes]MCG7871467.1 PAS domain-containing protein [Candidatus Thiodiazotropha lotti]MCG7902875.1 PAS domain-containing protein [Candidatus Thiodiazotropha weberae]MCG7912556.1 PAS domain-containing protein [Candidatus Thiodiazotropha weberae]MCG7983969.1 PAS domain-containing protein [Candidatus Thiodiazotropha lotti]MCG7991365.1 PAS domain-containing protein [Candidatus Thiodiazotropha lotti]